MGSWWMGFVAWWNIAGGTGMVESVSVIASATSEERCYALLNQSIEQKHEWFVSGKELYAKGLVPQLVCVPVPIPPLQSADAAPSAPKTAI